MKTAEIKWERFYWRGIYHAVPRVKDSLITSVYSLCWRSMPRSLTEDEKNDFYKGRHCKMCKRIWKRINDKETKNDRTVLPT